MAKKKHKSHDIHSHHENKEDHESHHENKEHHESHHTEHHPKKERNNTFKNPWAISTIVLAIILVIVLLLPNSALPTGTSAGAAVGEEKAGQIILDFAEAQGLEAELVNVVSENGLYKVNVKIEDQEVPVYITTDGENLVPSVISIKEILSQAKDSPPTETPRETPQPANIPKSDKPKVELYIWSYCPYGVTAQGPLAEVVSILEKSADFETVMYYDGHGAYETQQNKIQACIQKLDKENYWAYAKGFVSDVYPKCSSSRDIECDKTESIKVMDSLGINSAKVLSCVETDGASLIAEHSNKARTNGVTGSPTLIVNGVKANVARTSEAFKSAICSGFNTAPEACLTTLDSTQATTTGNC